MHSKLSDSLVPGIFERLNNGETATSIGSSFGVSRSAIVRLLKRNGHDTGFRSNPKWAMNYKLTQEQISVLVGDMFGDGGLVLGGPESAYYQCGHGRAQEFFVQWKYRRYSPLSCRYAVKDNRVTMATWSNKELFKWWKLFYPSRKGNKEIRPELVKFLDWRGLAVWFMGDGTRDRNHVRFSVGRDIELIPIVEAMNEKFGGLFEAKPYEREWFLNVRNSKEFFNGISEYLLPAFRYKRPEAISQITFPCLSPIMISSENIKISPISMEDAEADLYIQDLLNIGLVQPIVMKLDTFDNKYVAVRDHKMLSILVDYLKCPEIPAIVVRPDARL